MVLELSGDRVHLPDSETTNLEWPAWIEWLSLLSGDTI